MFSVTSQQRRAVDVRAVEDALTSFIRDHGLSFSRVGPRESQLLELGALVLAAIHYDRLGYTVTPGGVEGGEFRVKPGSRGYPWNFSWFEVQRGNRRFEVHGNLPVESAYDWTAASMSLT
jgi:hypothetical protein